MLDVSFTGRPDGADGWAMPIGYKQAALTGLLFEGNLAPTVQDEKPLVRKSLTIQKNNADQKVLIVQGAVVTAHYRTGFFII